MHLPLKSNAQVAQSDIDEPLRFKEVLAIIHQARPHYLKLEKLCATDPGYVDPQAYTDEVMTRAFADRSVWSPELRDRFFSWAATLRPVCKLMLVLATIDALADGSPSRAKAAGYATEALGLLQNFVHVQELHRQALGRETIDTKGLFCRAPFESLETMPDGEVSFCCPAWLPVAIGRLDDAATAPPWNSPAAQEIRRSILDGDYRYCSRLHCPKLSGGQLPKTAELTDPRLQVIAENRQTQLDEGPRRVVLSHDRSCNLACPSCRSDFILARKDEQERLNRLYLDKLQPVIAKAERVHVTSSGDPFGSAHFRFVLKSLAADGDPKLRLNLQTNGVLCDEAAWRDLGLAGRVDQVAVSIDAARPETYAIVRRGGDLARLLDNLDFLAKLRRCGEIKRLRLDCVVQARNIEELPEILALGRRFGCDSIKFQAIRNWNTMTIDDFNAQNVMRSDHPAHAQLRSLLSDPEMRGPDVDYWGFPDFSANA